MRLFLTGLLAVFMLNACTGGGPADMTQPAKQALEGANDGKSAERPAAVADVTTGDVEQKVFINGTLASSAVAPNILVNEMKDPRGKFNMTTIDVYQPFPEHLPLQFVAKTMRNWEDTPVVIRAKATIEGRPDAIGKMAFVWSKQAVQTLQEGIVDVMPALQPVPDSVLVAMRADALLMPPGTDAATIDPLTATTTEERTTGLISNPIRINFHQEPAPAQTPTAPAQ